MKYSLASCLILIRMPTHLILVLSRIYVNWYSDVKLLFHLLEKELTEFSNHFFNRPALSIKSRDATLLYSIFLASTWCGNSLVVLSLLWFVLDSLCSYITKRYNWGMRSKYKMMSWHMPHMNLHIGNALRIARSIH